jgi:hypothetical protein
MFLLHRLCLLYLYPLHPPLVELFGVLIALVDKFPQKSAKSLG